MMHSMSVCSGADIFDCIQRGNIEECIHYLQNDRSVLRQKASGGKLTLQQLLSQKIWRGSCDGEMDGSCDKAGTKSHCAKGSLNPTPQGWGGFTPLHYAALHGNRVLVDLFLCTGANPNLTSDAGQTAFHFACRQGNVYIIHQMMQYGADLRLIDLQGKTSLHHAVTGGNIVAVHYLWETGMFRFSDTDMYQVTPLHLAASTGNTEVVQYLLRNQRCAVGAVDQQGATALHVAAERGGVEVCWALLQRTGCRTLHEKNHSGLTPLDLSRQGKTFRHQQLTKLLSRYFNEPKHHKPRESHVLYYWTLLFPTLSGATILLIAAMFGGYGGLICAFCFPWLARSIFTQYHRLTTHQRLPNPIYMGTLLAGLFHSLLCFYGKMMPSVWPISALAQVSIIHFSILLALFCKVLTQDPGTLGKADADPRFSCIADLVENNQSPHRFCQYCELFQPDYTKHCKLCEVCIQDYDHHCLFLNRCVGRGNHRLFLFFILSMAVAHLLFVATGTSHLYSRTPPGGRSLSSWLMLLRDEFWVVVMMIMNVLTLLWEVWLLTEQFESVATGTTTYFRHCEGAARQRAGGPRWAVVLSFLLEGRRRVGGGQNEEDKTAIDI